MPAQAWPSSASSRIQARSTRGAKDQEHGSLGTPGRRAAHSGRPGACGLGAGGLHRARAALPQPIVRRADRAGVDRAHAAERDRDGSHGARLPLLRHAWRGQDEHGARVRPGAERPEGSRRRRRGRREHPARRGSRRDRDRRREQPRRRRRARPDLEGGHRAGAQSVPHLHHRRGAHAHHPGLQRAVEDHGGAALAREVHPLHDRAAQGAGDHPEPLPALRLPPHSHRAHRGAPEGGARAGGTRGRGVGGAPGGAARQRQHARRAQPARPPDRRRERLDHGASGRGDARPARRRARGRDLGRGGRGRSEGRTAGGGASARERLARRAVARTARGTAARPARAAHLRRVHRSGRSRSRGEVRGRGPGLRLRERGTGASGRGVRGGVARGPREQRPADGARRHRGAHLPAPRVRADRVGRSKKKGS